MVEGELSVLSVEDDNAIADLVRSALEQDGFRVRTVADGQAALAALDAERPDVVLLDLMLPDMDGLEWCARVRDQDTAEPYLPILMVTALDTPDYRQLGFARGADDYITKPFDLNELRARVRVWAGASRRIRELHAARERLMAERQAAQDQAIRHMALAIPDAVNQNLGEVYRYSELLGQHPAADPTIGELCQRLHDATTRLVATVDQLANAARYVTKHYGADREVLDVERAAAAVRADPADGQRPAAPAADEPPGA
jgi:DNA-binding response OmpR family regulator